jgi:hypothetical protein
MIATKGRMTNSEFFIQVFLANYCLKLKPARVWAASKIVDFSWSIVNCLDSHSISNSKLRPCNFELVGCGGARPAWPHEMLRISGATSCRAFQF